MKEFIRKVEGVQKKAMQELLKAMPRKPKEEELKYIG